MATSLELGEIAEHLGAQIAVADALAESGYYGAGGDTH